MKVETYKFRQTTIIINNYTKYFRKYIKCYQIGKNLFIGTLYSKANAVSYLSNLEEIPKDNIFTIH